MVSKGRECFKKEKRLIVLSATDGWRLKYSHWVKRQVIGGLAENRLAEWWLKDNCRAPLQYRNSQPLSLTLISIGTWVLTVCWLPSSILKDSFPGWALLTPTEREQPPRSSFQNILLLPYSQSPPNPLSRILSSPPSLPWPTLTSYSCLLRLLSLSPCVPLPLSSSISLFFPCLWQ